MQKLQVSKGGPSEGPIDRPIFWQGGNQGAHAPEWLGASPGVWLSAFLGALLIARVLALYVNATDLFFDEAQYWSWGKEPAFGYYSKPPLIAWIIGATTNLCGDSTFCVRLPAPILHTTSAAVIFWIGRRFMSAAAGFWSALAFATLPGITLSSGIISTDVPLLLAWALALWAYMELLDTDRWWPAVLLGVAFGLGLNAKYAMVFFVLSIGVHMAVTPNARRLLTDPRLWAGLGLGAVLILPNMAWNLSNKFATFAHTADNAKWGGSLLNIGKGLEFAGAQLGVFGPILFVSLVSITWRAWRQGLPDRERLLLAFTLPVLLLITAQAFVSRAHANWAAVAYVAGTLLVSSTLLRLGQSNWLKRSLALHLAIVALLSLGLACAGRFTVPGVGDPFQRLLGWKGLVDDASAILDQAQAVGKPFEAVFADDRSITAELLYYMRGKPTPVRAWRENGRPRDHFELTRPFKSPAQVPALLVSVRRDATNITKYFQSVELLGEHKIAAGLGEPRTVRFYALSGLKSEPSKP